MFIQTGDPLHDFNSWDEENGKWLQKRPKCCECGEHIQDDYLYQIREEVYCEKCIEGFRKYIF